jgi:hypothetical protein
MKDDRTQTGTAAGHADSPRQDTQRPSHRDRADIGGQESQNERVEATHIETKTVTRPGVAAERALAPPHEGRQPERPGQPGRVTSEPGLRDPGSLAGLGGVTKPPEGDDRS